MSGGHKDLIGERFGNLVVTGRAKKNPTYPSQRIWSLVCDCGGITTAPTKMLTAGDKLTCGKCEFHSKALAGNKTHGKSNTKLFRVWFGILERCSNPKLTNYCNYGGRGISVCPEWRNSFEEFYNWSEISGYTEGLTIERINNDKGYAPENCKWATRKEQANNRRTNRLINYLGETKTVAEWERVLGFGRNVVSSRLKAGWPTIKAISTPSLYKRGGPSH